MNEYICFGNYEKGNRSCEVACDKKQECINKKTLKEGLNETKM